MKIRMIVSFMILAILTAIPGSSMAMPVLYSLHGTAYFSDLSEEIFGIAVIDSEPSFLQKAPNPDGYINLSWLVNSITINTNFFQFYGEGFLQLSGEDRFGQMYDQNEPRITGYGIISNYIGNMFVDDVANLFYHEDRTPYELTMSAYITEGLPYMISSSGWRIVSNDNYGNRVFISNFSAIRETVAPVPEPITLLLVGSGLVGILILNKKERG